MPFKAPHGDLPPDIIRPVGRLAPGYTSSVAAPTFSGGPSDKLCFNLAADHGDIPASTTAITVRLTQYVQEAVTVRDYIIAAESTAFSLASNGGSLEAVIEDSTGTKVYGLTDTGLDITTGVAVDITMTACLVDDKLWITLDDSTTEIAMTAGSGVFASNKAFLFFALVSADNRDAADYTVEKVELWYDKNNPETGGVPAGDPDWSVTGPQATAEADPNAVTA